jgi:hypothetical protein
MRGLTQDSVSGHLTTFGSWAGINSQGWFSVPFVFHGASALQIDSISVVRRTLGGPIWSIFQCHAIGEEISLGWNWKSDDP